MVQRYADVTPELYLLDETAWLEATAQLVRAGRLDQLDTVSLAEYLTDMAIRDRREVLSRLVVLLAHLLKWSFQPNFRSGSWRATIDVQQGELIDLLESGTLRNHAGEVLPKAFERAVRAAAGETGLPESTFPTACPYTVDQLLSADLLADGDA